MKTIRILLASFLLLFAMGAYSGIWDGNATGKILQFDVTSGNNYGFRISLKGRPKLCGNQHNWAYINERDSNYKVYVSALMAAYTAGKKVTVYTKRKDRLENGYCHIGHISVR